MCCSKKEGSTNSSDPAQQNVSKVKMEYRKFVPDTLKNYTLDSFEISHAYLLGDHKLLVGNYDFSYSRAIKIASEEGNWGDRIIILDKQDSIVFEPKGATDLYMYEPYFWQDTNTMDLVVVCQRAFEYFFGGEGFLINLDQQKFIRMGEINVESHFEDGFQKKMVDVLAIKKDGEKLIFSFDCDSLLMFETGLEEQVRQNNGITYVFENDSLRLNY